MCDSLTKIDSSRSTATTSSLSLNASSEESRTFIDSKYAESILSQMYGFYDDGKFTDFELTSCDRIHFKVHSIVLAAATDYFHETLLANEMHFVLEYIDSETLEEIIRFWYLGHVRLSPSNIEPVLLAAHEMKIEPLKVICCEYLQVSLDADNCLRYAFLAEKCELKVSKELVEKFFKNNCSKICELKEFHNLQSFKFNDFMENLSKIKDGLFDELMKQVHSNNYSSILPEIFFKDLFHAIFRSFFIAGYIESMGNLPDSSRSTKVAVPKPLAIMNEVSDRGLFIVTKGRTANVLDFYAISDSEHTRTILSKYRINTDGMNVFTIRVFPYKDKVYVCYLTRNQRLEIKCWSFKSLLMTDILVPPTVQYLKPRLISAVGEDILVSEEKYVTWPFEGYKTTACKFGLESESYRSIEFNYDSLKEIICIGDDIFAFSNQKPEVVSFDLNRNKRTSRGTLNNNGIVKAVVFHGILYAGCYIRSKCTLYVEQFFKRENKWKVIGSICTYTDSSNFHIAATEQYLYVFYGSGKMQRYNDTSRQWTSLDFADNFDQHVLCVSNSSFTCN